VKSTLAGRGDSRRVGVVRNHHGNFRRQASGGNGIGDRQEIRPAPGQQDA